MKKYTNENAAHSRPTFTIVMNQKSWIFCRFSVALVGLSEPDPLDAKFNRIEPKPWNPRVFHEIEIHYQCYNSCAGRSTTIQQKSHAQVYCSGILVQIRWGETGKSLIFTKIINIHQNLSSNGSGSDRSTRNRQNTLAHFDSNSPPCSLRVILSNENKSSTNPTTVHSRVLLDPPPYI